MEIPQQGSRNPSSLREAHVHDLPPTPGPSGLAVDLPPGWRVDAGASGAVRILCPLGDSKWVEVPVVDDPLVGSETERAALARLKEWRRDKGRRHERRESAHKAVPS